MDFINVKRSDILGEAYDFSLVVRRYANGNERVEAIKTDHLIIEEDL